MDERELVELLRKRDERGADELLHRYGPMLRYIIAPILSDSREREECLSDVVMRAWDRIGQFDPERGGFPAWLSAVARNTARNRLRAERSGSREMPEPDHAVADPSPGPEEVLLREEETLRLRKVIAGLGSMERELFYRKYYYLQPTAQMAAELGLTERAVEGRLRRLRGRLRKELGGERSG